MIVLWQRALRSLLIFGFAGLLLDSIARLGAEWLWFQEVGYLPVFLLRLGTQGVLWSFVSGVTIVVLLFNLAIAEDLKYVDLSMRQSEERLSGNPEFARYDQPRQSALKFRVLLPLSLGLSLLIGLICAHYGQAAVQVWQGNTQAMRWFNPFEIAQLDAMLGTAIAVLILIYPKLWLRILAIAFSILLGYILSKNWAIILTAIYPTQFEKAEPLFNRDISFYIFSLPLGELILLWLSGLFFFGFASVTLTYLLSGKSLSEGQFPGFSVPQKQHLYGLGSGVMGAISLSNWLRRYELLYSQRGVSYGASYTDVFAQLPVYIVLSLATGAIAVYLLVWRRKIKRRAIAICFVTYGGLIAIGYMVPALIQFLVVEPNELVREQPYIQRTIALTRQAFGLETIDAQTFNPQGRLTQQDLQNNALTIRNIRLWDERPLLDTNRQLQQIRLYYRFPGADIDRYTVTSERRQVLIAARELDSNAIPQQAQTWINQHLIYTHGYGFTVSPVNTVAAGGLPEYFVKDIGGTESSDLLTSNATVRASIPIGRPRIYYGEITNSYVMTGTRVRELDYPSGSDNAYNVYDGQGGIPIGSWWRRALFAMHLKDWNILFTREFLPETKVLFRRNITERIQAIAPFLQYDRDPYLVSVNTGSLNHLYWIVDAYTTSDRYPYSEPTQEKINYIRNSVKIIVDAYNGTVNFYVADLNDPMIQTWAKIFPTLLKPLSAMPVPLRQHIRYPVDLFNIQSERLMNYHMTDSQVFYNREDQWQIPNEIYGSEARPVEPYYLITSLPTVPFEEFILLLPYTPRERTNLVAWLAARSDGENYGRLLLYTFPKERLVYGTEQIEARINQDPVISQQISLWNRQGSRVIQGNLLVIPIEQSLLYVEPLYLEATQNSLPTLVRVVMAYENRIVMAQSLEAALQAIFRPDVTPAPTIIRPVDAPE
jgi:uncharacterized protein